MSGSNAPMGVDAEWIDAFQVFNLRRVVWASWISLAPLAHLAQPTHRSAPPPDNPAPLQTCVRIAEDEMNVFAVRCGEARGGRRSRLSGFPEPPSRLGLWPPWKRLFRLSLFSSEKRSRRMSPFYSRKLPSTASLLFTALLAAPTSSCVSVPQEAVVLSNLVGTQIASHRASHEEFVHRYYARSRDVVELFLRDRWVPEYLETFVGESEVMELLITPDEVFGGDQLERLTEEILAVSGIGEVRAPLVIQAVSRVIGNAERGQVMLDFAEVALAEIDAQRSELLNPLDRQEMEVLDHLAESYAHSSWPKPR